MGLVHSYELFLRPRDLRRALEGLARLAAPGRGVPPLEVTLAEGERIALPFTAGFASEPVDAREHESFDLDLSLVFAPDEALREYARENCLAPEPDGRVRIEYVYATVRPHSPWHPGYASLDCWAATSRMSRLFARSTSIRKAFADLTAESGGVCCLFDYGDGSCEDVWGRPGGPAA